MCAYKEWTGQELPDDLDELRDEELRLAKPTFPEFADDKLAALTAVKRMIVRLTLIAA